MLTELGIGPGAELARTCRMLRNHGQDLTTRFLYHRVGFNCRMDETVAGFLLRCLPLLDRYPEERRRLAERYDQVLRDLAPAVVPLPGAPGRAVYTYVVRVHEREALREHLARSGIETAVFYQRPLHLQAAFAHLGYGLGDFPAAERLSRECLALPLYPEMEPGAVDHVAAEIARFYKGALR